MFALGFWLGIWFAFSVAGWIRLLGDGVVNLCSDWFGLGF